MPSPRSGLCLVLIIATAGFMAGCEASVSTGGDTVDADNAADTIQQQYPAESGGLALDSISCDSGDAEVDATFTCSGENEAAVTVDIEATVTEVNEDSGDVKFDWSITKATSDGTAYSDVAVTTLQNQGYAVASIECPEIVIERGNEVDCRATMDDGTSQTARITLTNESGGFNVVTSGPG